jgi:hypothetical protein
MNIEDSCMTITSRQGQVLAFIHRFTERYGVSPSFDDIAVHFGITSPSVNGMIRTLERKGLLSRIPGAARTLRVEAPAGSLPKIDFGHTSQGSQHTEVQTGLQTSKLASSTAIAVLDTILPMLLSRGATQDEAITAVRDSASHVHEVLTRMGIPPEDTLAVARSIAAEISRWQPNGRGTTIRRYIWKRG